MKVYLMYRNQDFTLENALLSNESDLIQDLELNTLLEVMAHGDDFLRQVAKRALLSSLTVPEEIVYRQQVLIDSLKCPSVIRGIYETTIEAIQADKKIWWWVSKSPESTLHRSVELLGEFLGILRKLRQITDANSESFQSEGFNRFFKMITIELSDEYLFNIQDQLRRLKFENEIVVSATLGKGCKGENYILRRPSDKKRSWMSRYLPKGIPANAFTIAERDEAGHQALSELRAVTVNEVANILAQSTDHIFNFFKALRTELGFYIGCLNVHEQLVRKGEPTCIPTVLKDEAQSLFAQDLYDICLSLQLEERAVGNDVAADNKNLVIITGANQGGKTTFLRSVGLAYLMMQCGMFVPAKHFTSNTFQRIFTHFKRREDVTMSSGKLDEEMKRMSEIADQVTTNSILLCNESFSSTNEIEGSQIARQVIDALLDAGITVFFVTFLIDFAEEVLDRRANTTLFLRAERLESGQRTFKMIQGEPLSTSYGEDLYKQVFGIEYGRNHDPKVLS